MVLLLYYQEVMAQERIFFDQLTESVTNCILKDSDGFIWIGTQDGLLRYDHATFKSYRYEVDNPYSLPNNYIWSLLEDKNEKIWIGTFGGGLAMWDKEKERFYHYGTIEEAASIHALQLFQDSILLLGTENGLYSFNIRTRQYISNSDCGQNESCFINTIYITDEDDQYLGTNEGLYIRKEEASTFSLLNLIPENSIVHDIEGTAHIVYIGTNKGLYIYNKRKSTMEHQLEEYPIESILLIDNDEWYVGTSKGLGHFIKESGYQWYESNEGLENSLKSNFIHVLYEIEEEIIWAGTRKGIHQFSIRPLDFYTLNSIYNQTSCSRTVLGMTEDKHGDIWICSRDGLMHITVDSEMRNWAGQCHTPANTPGMKNSYTINITNDSEGNLWLAYRTNGFSKLTYVNGNWEWTNFEKAESILEGDGVNQVFQDRAGAYWLASRGKGLIKFDPVTQDMLFWSTEEGLSHPYIFRIYEGANGLLWLSTANGGLSKFDPKTEKFLNYTLNRNDPSGISASMVLATNEYSDQRLLVATTSGLDILNNNSKFQHINTLDGLPNNVIYGALEDDNGNVWVSTNEGISKIDLRSEKVKTTNYTKAQGLASLEFNQHSYLEHSSGLFLFGGVEGVTVFNPLKVESRRTNPKIVFTDFQLFNNSVEVAGNAESEFYLEKSINETSEIRLKHDQNSLAFEFAALGFVNEASYKYYYKMAGLEDDWTNADKRNYASYPKMPPGKYEFIVQLVDQNLNFIGDPRSVSLSISRPPWKTWWAYSAYVVLALLSVWGILRFQTQRTRQIAEARENERSIFRKKMSRDFHDEAGNKITMISLLTDHATRKSNEENIVKIMHQLQDNIQELRTGMQDFIWVLDPAKDTLFDVLLRLRGFAQDSFEHAPTEFIMDPISPDLQGMPMPGNVRRHFVLIFKEAITNILKYAAADMVSFKHKRLTDGKMEFKLMDDGKGFDIDRLDRINGINNMKARAEKIDAQLSVRSKINEGTEIILTL